MTRILLAAALAVMLAPAASNAQFYAYNVQNSPFGSSYTYRAQVGPYSYAVQNTPYGSSYAYRVQNGPYSYAVQGFRPNPGVFPYWGNPYTNYGNYPYPVNQSPPQVIVQQPIIIQQIAPVVAPINNGNNIPAGNIPAAGNGFGFGGGNNMIPPKRFGDGLAIPPDVKPAAKNDAVVEAPKVFPPPAPAARIPAAAPKAEMPRVAARPAGIELARKAVEAGQAAFADGEYGRALEFFRKAVDQNPNDPTSYYLLAQAQFAVGKYREAVASIAAGMTFKGDWSSEKFQPRGLYGKSPETFDAHMNLLKATVVQFPDDAGLSFLLGHQLWFDDKPDQAKPHLLTAKAAGRGASPADLFIIP